MNDAITAPPSTIGESLKSYALKQLDEAATMLGRHGDDLYPGIHEARKAVRHVRATLRLGRKPLGAQAAVAIEALKELNESLSSARDSDVAIETLDRLVASSVDTSRLRLLGRIRRAFDARRSAQLHVLLEDDPDLGRRIATVRRLRELTEALSWKN